MNFAIGAFLFPKRPYMVAAIGLNVAILAMSCYRSIRVKPIGTTQKQRRFIAPPRGNATGIGFQPASREYTSHNSSVQHRFMHFTNQTSGETILENAQRNQ